MVKIIELVVVYVHFYICCISLSVGWPEGRNYCSRKGKKFYCGWQMRADENDKNDPEGGVSVHEECGESLFGVEVVA